MTLYKLANIELQYSPLMKGSELQNLRAGLQQIGAQIKLINAQSNLTEEQKASEVEKRTSYILDNEAKGIDNTIKNSVKKYVIQGYKEDVLSKYIQNRYAPSSHLTPWLMMERQFVNP